MAMNSYERVMNSIEGKAVDHVAVAPFVMAFSAKFAGIPYGLFASNYKYLAEAQIKTCEYFCFDAVTVDSDAYREASALGAVVQFPQDELPVITQHAISDKAKFAFSIPDIGACPRLVDKIQGVAYLKNYYKNDKAIIGWVESPFQSAGTLYDISEFMMDIYEEPGFIKELLDFTAELGVAFALEQAAAGADIIGVGDAMASMISPEIYKSIVLPYTKKLVDGIRKKSMVKLKYHMCGNSKHLLPFIKEIGFDIINIDHKTDMQEAYSIIGDTACIKGNIDPVSVLKDGTPEMVAYEVQKLMDLNQPRFILSAGCEVARDTPHEALHTLVLHSAGSRGM